MCRDLPLLHDASTVNASFNALPKEANGFPANRTLQDFIAANFGTAGSDFESALPDDFSSEPEDFLTNVTDPAIRQWALQVNDLWQDLCREVFLLTIHPCVLLHTVLPADCQQGWRVHQKKAGQLQVSQSYTGRPESHLGGLPSASACPWSPWSLGLHNSWQDLGLLTACFCTDLFNSLSAVQSMQKDSVLICSRRWLHILDCRHECSYECSQFHCQTAVCRLWHTLCRATQALACVRNHPCANQ